jgi:phosphoribosylglycinamide formyltransferase-1
MRGQKLNIVVLISGRGSNMENLARHSTHFSINGVVCNNPDAPGLEIAHSLGLKTISISKTTTLKAQKAEIYECVRSLKPDLIVLAGFMQILEPEFVSDFLGRIINIHPSLLPKYPGLHTHQRAIDAGDTSHGCSVHIVDSGIDTGPVIAQAAVEVKSCDTADSLQKKVLVKEHKIYPWVINSIGAGEIKIEVDDLNKKIYTRYSNLVYKEATELNFCLPER